MAKFIMEQPIIPCQISSQLVQGVIAKPTSCLHHHLPPPRPHSVTSRGSYHMKSIQGTHLHEVLLLIYKSHTHARMHARTRTHVLQPSELCLGLPW